MDLKYTIQKGDTLSKIAEALDVDMRELAEANNIEDANKIFAGKKLSVPSRKEEEAVKVQEMQKAIKSREPPVKPKAVERNIVDKALGFFIPSASASPEKSILEKPKSVKKEKNSEPILPSNVRQFLYDLAGGKETFTEKDLKTAERKALIEVVKAAKNRKSKSIDYPDYETTGKANAYADIGGKYATNETNKKILSKVSDATYSLKTLIGAANIVEDDNGNTLVIDRYNFNDAESFSVSGFAKGVADAGISAYKQARNVAKFFGSGEGEGSPVVINLGKLNNV